MRTESVTILKLRLPEGFSLRDRDEDIAELLYRGEVIGEFAARGVDPETVKAVAEAYIAVDAHSSK